MLERSIHVAMKVDLPLSILKAFTQFVFLVLSLCDAIHKVTVALFM